MYELAHEEKQKYKEGRYILEWERVQCVRGLGRAETVPGAEPLPNYIKANEHDLERYRQMDPRHQSYHHRPYTHQHR